MSKDRIDAKKINELVEVESEIIVYETTDSTNTRLKELAKAGAKTGTVIIAENQTLGRGRLGRQFYSPSNSGIYMSLLLRPEKETEIGMITAFTAVAVCNALEKVYDIQSENNGYQSGNKNVFGIKWVNDIQKEGKKICGILAEAGSEKNTTSYIIVGIGINVYPPKEGFPTEIKNIAGSVFENEEKDLRNVIISEVINNFYSYKSDFVSEYKDRSVIIGKKINVHSKGNIREAIAVEIDDNCNLKVRYENGEDDTLSFGEISVREI